MVKNIFYIVALVLLAHIQTSAQPHFGNEQGSLNYRGREMMINPAYVGSVPETHRRLSLSAGWQWVGMDGAPKTQELQFQSGLPNALGGVGAWLYHEGYGVTDVIQFGAVYGYTLKLTEGHNLSLGLNINALTVSEDAVSGIDDPNDPMFAQSTPRVWGFNSGFGAMLYGDSYYVGLSMPQLLTNNWEEGASKLKIKNTFKFDQLQFYLTGGYVFELSEDISLIPNALLQYSANTSFGYEFMVRGDYAKRVMVGVGYGYDKAIKAEAGVFISKEVSLAYRYEQSFGSVYKNISGSHLITLSVTWDRDKNSMRLF